jgi:hypothetical protein
MSEFDDQIRETLRAHAERVHDTPAPAELTDGVLRRERRHRRALTGALVVSLFAGPVLGFVAGRGRPEATAKEATKTHAVKSSRGVVIHDDKVPTLSGDVASAPASSGGTASLKLPESTVSGGAMAVASAPALIYGTGYGEPLARFFDRDANGVKVRVFHADVAAPTTAGPPWWQPAEWCFPSGVVQADVSTDTMVGIANGSVFTTRKNGTLGGSLSLAGVSEGDSRRILVAQSTTPVASIRVTFPGGATDVMAPVDGVAVLVGDAHVTQEQFNNGLGDMKAHLQSLDASGAIVAETDAALYGGDYVDGSDQSCYGPQSLPQPGAEQPADPAAARAEIASHFGGPAGTKKVGDVLGNLDDPRGMEDVWNQLITGPFGKEAQAAETIFRDLVFLSPTRAAVQYDVHIPNYTDFNGRFAEYVLVDGTWKETRESLCRDISLAGITCPPLQ